MDPVIAQIEAELRESRFKPWDAETFLAERHRAKIEALTEPQGTWSRRWEVTKEAATIVSAFVGYLAISATVIGWVITGDFVLKPRPAETPILIAPLAPPPRCPSIPPP
jgi:hypothetical protein